MKPLNFDLSLYLVTDRSLSNNRPIEWIVEEAVKGGVSIVQLREKYISTKCFLDLAIKLKSILSPLNIPLIINDRLDIALASNADGLHIGQSDMPYSIARKLLGKEKIIGLSVESIDQAREANNLDVDYIGISPVFITNTKTDISKPFGLDGIKYISSLTKHKSVGIGGINKSNTNNIIKAGCDGVAVVSAIVSADHPQIAASELLSEVKR